MRFHVQLSLSLILAVASLSTVSASATEPRTVAAQIDSELSKRLTAAKIPASPRADDAEYLRRVYLDLTGRIPSAARAAAFLDSTDPARRQKLVDELLASPEYGEHFATIWMNLIPRDTNQIRPPKTKPFQDWLAQHFHKNVPWDKLTTEILTATGSNAEQPPGVFFILSADSRNNPQANIITRNVSQLFLGVQLQCAECHDHPFTKWKQTDFWGMAAFFGKVKNSDKSNGKTNNGVVEVIAAKGKAKGDNGPRVGPGASIIIPTDAFKNVGKVVKAKYPAGSEPKLTTEEPFRPAFAKWLTSTDNAYFAPNLVNRLWAQFFGRGFVNPLNDFHEENPASHPELLRMLASEFVASGFDQKHLIRCICLSDAYQRTSQPVVGNKGVEHPLFSRVELKVLSPEMLYESLCMALEVRELFTPEKTATKKKAVGTLPPPLTPREKFLVFFNTKEETAEATEFSHGIPQALRLMNHAVFNKGGKTVDRLMKSGSTAQIIEGIYLAALARRPSDIELKDMSAYVSRRGNSREAYNGVLWTLINSAEFTLNH